MGSNAIRDFSTGEEKNDFIIDSLGNTESPPAIKQVLINYLDDGDMVDHPNTDRLLEILLAPSASAEVQQDMIDHVESNPDRAAILMEVMQDWLKRKQADPGDLSPADVERLAAWIQQQGVG